MADSTTRCAVRYADGTPCGRTAQLKHDLCRMCHNWSKRHGGASPQGRPKPTSGPGTGRKQCRVVEDGETCGGRVVGHGMCPKHHRRWSKTGDPLATAKRPHGNVLREVEAGAYATTDDCVLMDGNGKRPRALLGGLEMNASRAAWIVANGDPGDECDVLHTCHRGREGCINIRHLYLGDHARNMLDMVEAGRSGKGEKNGCHKLTEREVLEIRGMAAARVDYGLIADRYGVTKSTVSAIHVRKRWGWL